MALLKTLGLQKDHGAVAAASHDIQRSPHWSAVVKSFLKKDSKCDVCQESTIWSGIFAHQVHHIHAFHFCVLLGRPDLELDHRNLCILCQVPGQHHHLLIGHLGEFRSYNPQVAEFAQRYRGWSKAAIEADPFYQQAAANRPKVWGDLTLSEKTAMRAMLDRTLPPDPKVVALVRQK